MRQPKTYSGEFFLPDRVIGVAYIVYQLRHPINFVNSPENHVNTGVFALTLGLLILIPLLLTLPLTVSLRYGGILFLLEQIFTLWAALATRTDIDHTQISALALGFYATIRTLGLVGPPMRVRVKTDSPAGSS